MRSRAEERTRIEIEGVAGNDLEPFRVARGDLLQRGDRALVALDCDHAACAGDEERTGEPARAGADLDHLHAFERPGSARDPRGEVEIEKEILPERLLGAKTMPADHLAQRRKVIDGAHANAASAMAQQLNQQAQPLTPPPANQQANQPAGQQPAPANVAGGPVNFTVVPPASNQAVGSTFQVAVMLGNGRDISSVPLQLKFNPAVLQLVNVDTGDLLSRDGQLASLVHREDNGLVAISTTRPPNAAGVNGQGSLCTLTFKAIAAGDSDLTLVKVGAINSKQANLPAVGSQAVVHVK